MTIWKFPIDWIGRFHKEMPIGAHILSVQMQGLEPQMWALVKPENPTTVREFVIYGTGQQIEESGNRLEFIGTFQQSEGRLIWHLFEVLA